MQGKDRIKENTIYNLIKTASTVVFPLITAPYIMRVLHVENVGKINFGNSIVNYISLLALLGIQTYAVRECSKVRDDKKELSKVASQIMSINIFSSVVAYFTLFLLLLFWNKLEGYQSLVLVQSTSVLFIVLGADWLNTAMEDFRYITVRTFLFQIISLIAMFLFVRQPEHYMRYVCITVFASCGSNILNMFYRRKYCKIRLTFHIDWKKHFPPIIFLFAMILAQTIYMSVDTTMIGVYRGDLEVGLYSIATKIYNLVNQMVASIALVVMPQLSTYFSNENYYEVNRILRYSASVIITLGLPCVIGLNVLAPEIVEIFGGAEYLPAVPALRLLTVALSCSFAGGLLLNIIFLPSNKEKVSFGLSLMGAVINFSANILLIPRYGFVAAAFTTALSELVVFLVAIPFVDKRIKIIRIASLIRGPVVGGVLIIFIGVIIERVIDNLWMRTAMVIILSVFGYGITQVVCKNELATNVLKNVAKKCL